jgi:hypothetical protein
MSEELDIRSLSIANAAKLLKIATKTALLKRHVDIGHLFGAYTWDTLPTRYLTSYTLTDQLKKMDAVARPRAEQPWPTPNAMAARSAC